MKLKRGKMLNKKISKKAIESWILWVLIAIVLLAFLTFFVIKNDSQILRPGFEFVKTIFKSMQV